MDFIRYLVIGIGIVIITWVSIKQKPWWQLTSEEKKKRMPLVIAGIFFAILGIVVFLIASK
ncbi:hypothetical protein ACFLZ0_01830 [Patescibacteria group bacterium]